MNITTREQIKKKITGILLDLNWIKPGEGVHERHSYGNDYGMGSGMGSIFMVEFVMELERCFGISIPYDVAERMDTVARTIDYLHQQLNNYGNKQN